MARNVHLQLHKHVEQTQVTSRVLQLAVTNQPESEGEVKDKTSAVRQLRSCHQDQEFSPSSDTRTSAPQGGCPPSFRNKHPSLRTSDLGGPGRARWGLTACMSHGSVNDVWQQPELVSNVVSSRCAGKSQLTDLLVHWSPEMDQRSSLTKIHHSVDLNSVIVQQV